MKDMKIMKKIHVVSECMRRNRIHPLTPFFVPISCPFRVFCGKKWISLCLCAFVVKVPAQPVKFIPNGAEAAALQRLPRSHSVPDIYIRLPPFPNNSQNCSCLCLL